MATGERIPEIPETGEVPLKDRIRAARWGAGKSFIDIREDAGTEAYQAFERVERGWSKNPKPWTLDIIGQSLGLDLQQILAASNDQLREWVDKGAPGLKPSVDSDEEEFTVDPLVNQVRVEVDQEKEKTLLAARLRMEKELKPKVPAFLQDDPVFSGILKEIDPKHRQVILRSVTNYAAILRHGRLFRETIRGVAQSQLDRGIKSTTLVDIDPVTRKLEMRLKAAGITDERFVGIIKSAGELVSTAWFNDSSLEPMRDTNIY